MPIAPRIQPLAQRPSPTRLGLWLVFAAAVLGWVFDGVEMGLYPLCANAALDALVRASTAPGTAEAAIASQVASWFGAVSALFLLGAAAGGVLFGWLGDRVGRVKAMTAAVLVYSLFSAAAALAHTPMQLALPRLIASLGMGGEWALGVALVMETWPSSSRPLMAGIIGAAGNLGFLAIAVVGLGLAHWLGPVGAVLHHLLPSAWADALLDHQAWRLLLLCGAAPAIFTLFLIWFVPESESWRAAAGPVPSNRLSDILAPTLRTRLLQASLLSSIALIGTWGSTQWIPTWAAHLPSAGAAPAAMKSMAQIASAAGAMLGCVIGALSAQWTSRRLTYFLIALASLIASAILFHATLVYGALFLALTFLVGASTAAFYGWIPLYLPELFPTRVRATAQGFAYNAGRVLAAGGTLVSGTLVSAFGGDVQRMCGVLSLIYVVGLIAIWFCPETKGRDLPA